MMTIGSFVPAVSMVAVAPNPVVAEAYPAVAPNPVVAEAYPDADPNPVVESARRPACCRSWDKIWFLD
jgi:photosystem II stability/assembly factor-like uncharacterized protein